MTERPPTERRGVNAGAIWTAVVVAALVVFVFQNTVDAPVEFLFLDITMPVWLLVVVSMVLGASLGWVWRRGRRRT